EQRGGQRGLAVPVEIVETLRNCSQAPEAASPPKGEERISVFWRIFGGTLLSIAALVVMTLCQHFSNSLHELRNDLSRINDELPKDLAHVTGDLRKDLNRVHEYHSDIIKKEEFNSRLQSMWTRISEIQELKVAVDSLKAKDMLHEQQQKDASE